MNSGLLLFFLYIESKFYSFLNLGQVSAKVDRLVLHKKMRSGRKKFKFSNQIIGRTFIW